MQQDSVKKDSMSMPRGHKKTEILTIWGSFRVTYPGSGLRFHLIVSSSTINKIFEITLFTKIGEKWLLLATLPLYHPVQDLKMTPLLQFTSVHFLKSTPLPLLTPVCNFEALLGASLISMNQQVLLRPGTPVNHVGVHKFRHVF